MPATDTSAPPSSEDLYDIAAVCRLTGLTAPNLRVWEKRYQVTKPSRTESGRRQYTRRDVQRLTLLKALSDQGHRIQTTASLPIAELEKRLEESARSSPSRVPSGGEGIRSPHACRIGIIGSHLGGLASSGEVLPPNATVLVEFLDLEEAESQEPRGEIDLLLIECPALFGNDISRVERLIDRMQALRAIVVFAYAQRQTLECLQEENSRITAIRSPISAAELKVVCATDIALTNRSASAAIKAAPEPREVSEEIPDRRFSNRQIAEISQMSSVVNCECPHHLASLLSSLNGFESYSAGCENRNAADAEMHAYLQRMTAHARAIVEDSLQVLLEFEGIEVGETE